MSSTTVRHNVRPELLETAELVPIDELVPFPGNARLHDDELLRESLQLHGQYRAIVVRREGRIVLAGNGTMSNARDLGWTHIAVSWVDCDDATARKINLLDNKASDEARDDESALLELLAALQGNYVGTGWAQSDYDRLLAERDEPLTFEPDESGGDTRLDRRSVTDCPQCGHTFTPKTRSVIVGDDGELIDDE